MPPARAGAEKNTKNAVGDKAMKCSSPIIPGFFFNGLSAGIKKDGQKDMGLIFSETPAVTAGVFTTNWVKAAPVTLTIQHLQQKKCQAVLVNSGNANACTGKQGMADARALVHEVSRLLNIDPELVAIASTGVIGEFLPLKKMLSCMSSLCKDMKQEKYVDFARSILTTDTVTKIAVQQGTFEGKVVSVAGIAKGAGMINPFLATMLVFIVTDVAIRAQSLQALLDEGAREIFNLITVDGDTSTNDMVLLLANGRARNRALTKKSAESTGFKTMLFAVMEELARKILYDGEGVTKVVEIKVKKAKSRMQAETIARSIAYSPLVKTSFYGEEVNWGRIIAAAGKTQYPISFERVDLFINRVPVVSKGKVVGLTSERKAQQELTKKNFTISLILHQGNQEASIFTTDLSHDYVKINAGYKS